MGRGEDGAELPPPRPSLAGLTTRWDGGASGVDSHRLSVAPMLDCTDTHFRRLCRLVSRRTHLWTEMINQDAVIHARRKNPDMLRHGEEEHPITVQLGGSDPARLARAAAVCDAEYRYDEINLNCGCPSAKVVAKPDASKCFGAVLMRDPELVGECLRRMREAVDVPVTIKHRLGVRSRERGSKKPRARDGAAPEDDLDALDAYADVVRFVDAVADLSGVDHFIVHARCAILGGLSPSANRTVPPLRHEEVHRLAEDFPRLGFTLNGGVESLDEAVEHLARGTVRGVMMGRAVYRNPAVLAEVDERVYGEAPERVERSSDAPPPLFSRDGWRDSERGSLVRSSFFDLESSPACTTRAEVLRRYALYGDAALRRKLSDDAELFEGARPKFPTALARQLGKAAHGLAYGVRGGAAFRREMEARFRAWQESIAAGTSGIIDTTAGDDSCGGGIGRTGGAGVHAGWREERRALGGTSLAELAEGCVAATGEWGRRDFRAPMRRPLETVRDWKENQTAAGGVRRTREDGGEGGGGEEGSREEGGPPRTERFFDSTFSASPHSTRTTVSPDSDCWRGQI